jgi:hypothetical protein
MLRATIGESVPLQIQAGDGRSDLYARASIYDPSGSLVAGPLDLSHLTGGLYGSTYIFDTEGHYTAVYRLFEDSGFVIEADYDTEAETIEASPDKTNILKALGLVHDNSIEDMHTYDGSGNLVGIRVRSYDTKDHLEAAAATSPAGGTLGLLFTWNITAAYTGGRLSLYHVAREP